VEIMLHMPPSATRSGRTDDSEHECHTNQNPIKAKAPHPAHNLPALQRHVGITRLILRRGKHGSYTPVCHMEWQSGRFGTHMP